MLTVTPVTINNFTFLKLVVINSQFLFISLKVMFYVIISINNIDRQTNVNILLNISLRLHYEGRDTEQCHSYLRVSHKRVG